MFLMTCMKTVVKTIITRQLWEGQGGAVPHKGFTAFYSIYPSPQTAALETEAGIAFSVWIPSEIIWSPKDMSRVFAFRVSKLKG